jgi:hypothetical protein
MNAAVVSPSAAMIAKIANVVLLFIVNNLQ